jgi:hypothetical protein
MFIHLVFISGIEEYFLVLFLVLIAVLVPTDFLFNRLPQVFCFSGKDILYFGFDKDIIAFFCRHDFDSIINFLLILKKYVINSGAAPGRDTRGRAAPQAYISKKIVYC